MAHNQDTGTKLIAELLRLHDSLEASKGVDHSEVKKVRAQQMERYWTLRGEIAKVLSANSAEAA